MNTPNSLSINKLSRTLNRYYNKKLKEFGITSRQFLIMHFIKEQGYIGKKECKKYFGCDRTVPNKQIQFLIKKGFLKYGSLAQVDIIRQIFVLTKEGFSRFNPAKKVMDECEVIVDYAWKKASREKLLDDACRLAEGVSDKLCDKESLSHFCGIVDKFCKILK